MGSNINGKVAQRKRDAEAKAKMKSAMSKEAARQKKMTQDEKLAEMAELQLMKARGRMKWVREQMGKPQPTKRIKKKKK